MSPVLRDAHIGLSRTGTTKVQMSLRGVGIRTLHTGAGSAGSCTAGHGRLARQPGAGVMMDRSEQRGGPMQKLAMMMLAGLMLAACDPAELADKAVRRAAESVVVAVVSVDMPTAQAQTATDCILNAATAYEIETLARDVGVVAGSLTRSTIREIALRPAAQACFVANSIPRVR